MHEQCGTECSGTECSRTAILNATSSAIFEPFEHKTASERPFRALWQHMGQARAIWSGHIECFGIMGGPERLLRALWRHQGTPKGSFRALWRLWASTNGHFVHYDGAGACSGSHFERFQRWQHWVRPARPFRPPSSSGFVNSRIYKT